MDKALFPSYFKPLLRSATLVIDLCMLLGLSSLAALLQLELFRKYELMKFFCHTSSRKILIPLSLHIVFIDEKCESLANIGFDRCTG